MKLKVLEGGYVSVWRVVTSQTGLRTFIGKMKVNVDNLLSNAVMWFCKMQDWWQDMLVDSCKRDGNLFSVYVYIA
jgi:hypothetical protein